MEDKWSEIEVSENKEDNKVEFEVEEKEKVEAKPEPEPVKAEEPAKEAPKELDGIETKGLIKTEEDLQGEMMAQQQQAQDACATIQF